MEIIKSSLTGFWIMPALLAVLNPKEGKGWGQTLIFLISLAFVFYANFKGISIDEYTKTILNGLIFGWLGYEIRGEKK